MKKSFLIASFFLGLVQLFGQSGWKADLRVFNESQTDTGDPPEHEYNVNMVADLYYNGSLVTPQPNY